MDGEFEPRNDGSQALKIVGIVLASLFALTLVCCGGSWFLGGRLVTELGEVAGARVQGSGVPAVNERMVRDFTGIRTEGLIDVDVTVGDEWSVMVRADDNILPLISTEVRGGTLVFESRGSYEAETDIHATVVMPAIDHVATNGLGDVTVTGVDAATLTVEIRGNGGVKAEGKAEALDLSIDGMGDARLFALTVRTATVDVSGMGDSEIHVTETLEVEVNGMGDVRYRGTPEITETVNGMGEVEPAE